MKQQGGVLIAAIFMIIIFGFVAYSVADIDVHRSHAVAQNKDRLDAFDVAEAGLNRAVAAVGAADAEKLVECSNITGSSNFTEKAFGNGQYTVTATEYSPDSATLPATISSVTSVVPLSSVTGFAPSGQVLIGSEVMSYAALGTSVTSCGTGFTACLTGVARGQVGTAASSHAAGAEVNQHLCQIESTGVVPNFSSVQAKTQVSKDLLLQVGEVRDWIVGRRSGGDEVFGGRKDSDFEIYGPYDAVPDKDLEGVFVNSTVSAWAVGDRDGTPNINFWNGSAWNPVSVFSTEDDDDNWGQNLQNVTCFTSTSCWAVGNRGFIMRYYNRAGSQEWVYDPDFIDSGVPTKTLFGVACYANGTDPEYSETGPTPYDCWAVGARQGSRSAGYTPLFLHWDGTATTPKWTVSSNFTGCVDGRNIRAISCVDSDDCWAVGDRVTTRPAGCANSRMNILRWNGTTWNRVDTTEDFNTNMYGVDCVSADECYAVGTRNGGHGLILKYDGSTWEKMNTDNLPNQNLYAVSCAGTGDCIAVGASGTIAKLTGSTWTEETTPTSTRLTAVDLLPNHILNSPAKVYQSHFRED